jgi:hypothetical protein
VLELTHLAMSKNDVLANNAKVSGNWGLKRSGSPQLSAGLSGYIHI